MKHNVTALLQQIWFIILCSIGGLLLTLMGLSIGWMVGSLLAAILFTYFQPKKVVLKHTKKGVSKYWSLIAQCLMGIELGRNMNMSFLGIVEDKWLSVFVVLLVSIVFSLLIGLVLYKYSNSDLLTSLLATAPGGVATMPIIAQEVGANTGVVSAVQSIRIIVVVTIVPIFLQLVSVGSTNVTQSNGTVLAMGAPAFEWIQLLWTVVFLLAAMIGIYFAKLLRLPAPWLLGSLLGVFVLELLFTIGLGEAITFWWPHILVIVGQVFIGVAIGSQMKKSMFIGIKRILIVSTIGTLFLVIAILGCSYLVTLITGLSFVTSVLAFAPGGVVEMATVSIMLHADSTFVVAVQTIRLVLVIMLVPPFINLVHRRTIIKNESKSV